MLDFSAAEAVGEGFAGTMPTGSVVSVDRGDCRGNGLCAGVDKRHVQTRAIVVALTWRSALHLSSHLFKKPDCLRPQQSAGQWSASMVAAMRARQHVAMRLLLTRIWEASLVKAQGQMRENPSEL